MKEKTTLAHQGWEPVCRDTTPEDALNQAMREVGSMVTSYDVLSFELDVVETSGGKQYNYSIEVEVLE